jgi:hypothetical protein
MFTTAAQLLDLTDSTFYLLPGGSGKDPGWIVTAYEQDTRGGKIVGRDMHTKHHDQTHT